MATIAETTQKITEENLKETQDVASNTETLVNLAKEEKAERDKNKILQLEANREARGLKQLMQDLLNSIRSGFDMLKDNLTNALSLDGSGGNIGLGLAGLLTGIGLGLEVPGLFNTKTLYKAIDNFKLNLDGWKTKFKNFFNIADDIPKVSPKVSLVDEAAKLTTATDGWKTKFKNFFNIADDIPKVGEKANLVDEAAKLTTATDGWKTKFKNFFTFADTDIPKVSPKANLVDEAATLTTKFDGFKAGLKEFFNIDMPKPPPAANLVDDAAGVTTSVIKYKDGLRTVFRNASGQFISAEAAAKLGAEGVDLSADAAKATTASTSMFTNVKNSILRGVGLMDETAAGVGVAAETAGKTGGFAGKLSGAALKLTTGFAGRVLSVAGNPVFDVIAQGKDIFDIASAATSDDVKAKVKNEDIGAVVGGFIGGAIGVIGGPAGVALGMGLGNMAGEFVGKLMDEPEIVGAIQGIEDELDAEKQTLVAETEDLKAKLAAAKESGNTKLANLYQTQIDEKNARVAEIDKEATELSNTFDSHLKEMDNIDKYAQAQVQLRDELEEKLKKAEEDGDAAKIAHLNAQIENTEVEIEKSKEEYSKKEKELQEKAREHSSKLAGASTSFFDKIATGGGFFGGLVSMLGMGDEMSGQAGANLIQKDIEELQGQIAMQQGEIKSGDKRDWKGRPRKAIILTLEEEIKNLKVRQEELLNPPKRHSGGPVKSAGVYELAAGEMVLDQMAVQGFNQAVQLVQQSRQNLAAAGGGPPMIINNIDNSQKTSAVQNSNQTVSVPTSPHNGQSTLTALQMATQIG